MSQAVVVYITSHGYGHATRTFRVLNELHRRSPGVRIIIRSAIAPGLASRYLTCPYEIEPVSLDFGVVERDLFSIDLDRTYHEAERFLSYRDVILATEVDWLRRNRPSVVLLDIPPLAARAAAMAGVPSVACGNFTWDFIYDHYAGWDQRFIAVAEAARQDLRCVDLMLALPLGHRMTGFRRAENVGLIAPITQRRPDVRRELGVLPNEPLVVVALRGVPAHIPTAASGVRVLSFGEVSGRGVQQLGPAWEPRFSEVIATADAVLTKPGYGIIAECLANARPILMLPRHGFPETDLLMTGLAAQGNYLPITLDELAAGELETTTRKLLAMPKRPAVAATGAKEVAERVIGMMG